jgi:hypothetical protein
VRETANEMRARLSSGEDDIRREKQRLDHIEAAVAAKSGHEETENKLSTKANIEEVNASIVSVIEELDKKASLQVTCCFDAGGARHIPPSTATPWNSDCSCFCAQDKASRDSSSGACADGEGAGSDQQHHVRCIHSPRHRVSRILMLCNL